jgi:hypothetical protein
MATTFLAATPIQDTFLLPGTNTPGNGVQLFCYAAGSSTKTTVYKDNAGATPWTNPIVLDSGGNLPSGGEVWQTQGQSMKYVYAPSNDTDPPASPYRTLDNMPGVNDVTAQTGVEWLTGPTPTFVSGTQFTLVGDQTATFTKGRRVKTTNTGGTVYSTIVNSTFGANTTVNIVNDASTLDAGLSAVSYGLFDPANVSISPSEIYRKGANVASAGSGTTDIWGVIGDYVHVTGTNTIQHFSTAPYAGAERTVIFDGVLTLSHNSPTIQLPGSVSVTTSANDRAIARADSVSTTIITEYSRAALPIYAAQASNTIFAGPASGVASTGSFRSPVGADGASLVLLASSVAASSASIAFTTSNGFGSVFDQYLIKVQHAQVQTHSTNLIGAVSVTGGANYDASANAYGYAVWAFGTNASSYPQTSGSGDTRLIFNGGAGNGISSTYASGGISLEILLQHANNTTTSKFLAWQGTYAGVAAACNITGSGFCQSATTQASPINAIQFSTTGGLINAGNFYLYGIRKS